MHEDGLTGWRPLGALHGIWLARVEIAIDEIRDDFDGPLGVKLADGLLLKIARDGGDAVALLDVKLGDG
jgi:hypothetical protein